jgi:hypothetical protein
MAIKYEFGYTYTNGIEKWQGEVDADGYHKKSKDIYAANQFEQRKGNPNPVTYWIRVVPGTAPVSTPEEAIPVE